MSDSYQVLPWHEELTQFAKDKRAAVGNHVSLWQNEN